MGMAGLWVVCMLWAENSCLGHLQSLAGKSVDRKRWRLPARPGLRVSECRSEREGLSSPLPPPSRPGAWRVRVLQWCRAIPRVAAELCWALTPGDRAGGSGALQLWGRPPGPWTSLNILELNLKNTDTNFHLIGAQENLPEKSRTRDAWLAQLVELQLLYSGA